jgi:phosphate transport system substrate-binding protein
MKVFQELCLLVALLSSSALPALAETISINGAGATFPAPLYTQWFSEYRQIDPSVEINYQPIGSGGGIRQLMDKTVDFGASDAPMTDQQLSKASPAIIHIPTVLGAVVITYNLPELKKPLQLSGEVVAEIFSGKITKWNDAKITKINPGVQMPATDMLVAHRSDGSGTTAVFSDYLSKVSPEWKQKIGAGTALNWPVGLGGKGNDGVTNLVKQTPGAIGFIELTYAETNKLPYASLKNKAGKFVIPSPTTVSASAAGALKTMPKDFRVSITDAAGKDAYPISAFTYLLVYQKMDAKKGAKLVKFLDWALKAGQKDAEPLHYAPLPKQMVSKVEARLKEIKTE